MIHTLFFREFTSRFIRIVILMLSYTVVTSAYIPPIAASLIPPPLSITTSPNHGQTQKILEHIRHKHYQKPKKQTSTKVNGNFQLRLRIGILSSSIQIEFNSFSAKFTRVFFLAHHLQFKMCKCTRKHTLDVGAWQCL